MRCCVVILFGLLSVISFKHCNALGVTDSIFNVKSSQDLPKAALKAKFRIQIPCAEVKLAGSLINDSKAFTSKYKLNTYVIRQGDILKLQSGDFSEKKHARQRLSYIKNKYPKAKIVKAENDSIIAFNIVEKKKTEKNSNNTKPGGTIAKPYTVRFEPPLPVADTAKKPKIENASANTAMNETYLSGEEKRVFYFLNLVRLNPKLFCDNYLSYLKYSKDPYESSLYKELQVLRPLPLLKPNMQLYESAKCHAEESGKSGYVGHERVKCAKYFMGECCQYGADDAFQIVVDLLIDQGVSSLGHRKICLSSRYSELGASIQPHKTYGVNTVIDFR